MKTVTKKIADLFGIDTPATIEVRERDPDCKLLYIEPDKHYVFQPVLLKKVLMFLGGQSPSKNLLLFGPTGAGKSSVILEVCSRLNIPVAQMACSGKTRFDHMTGSRDLVNGNTVFTDGPLLAAMRYEHGAVCLLDEASRLHPDEQMAMAPVLDRARTLTVKENSEVVTARPGFRLVCTGNSNGTGDETGMYADEKISSAAWTDRFLKIAVGYLPKESEILVLSRVSEEENASTAKVAAALRPIIPVMVDFANQLRSSGNAGPQLRTAISTRNLVNWLRLTVAYGRMNIRENIVEALRDTITNGAPADEAESIEKVWVKLMDAPEVLATSVKAA